MLLTASKASHALDVVDWRAYSQLLERIGGLVTGKGRAISEPVRSQKVMEAKKDKLFKPVSVVWKRELKCARLWDFCLTLISSTCLKLLKKNPKRARLFFGGRLCYDVYLDLQEEPQSNNDIHSIAIWALERPRIRIPMHVNTFIRNVGHVFWQSCTNFHHTEKCYTRKYCSLFCTIKHLDPLFQYWHQFWNCVQRKLSLMQLKHHHINTYSD